MVHSPIVLHVAVLELDVRGREDALRVFVTQGEPTVPPGVLLQDLNYVTKVEADVRVGLVGAVGVGN